MDDSYVIHMQCSDKMQGQLFLLNGVTEACIEMLRSQYQRQIKIKGSYSGIVDGIVDLLISLFK